MGEKKDNQNVFSTCLEGSPCAEMMQKMMGQQGIGSMCQEMMKSMTKGCCGSKEEAPKAETEEGHGSEK